MALSVSGFPESSRQPPTADSSPDDGYKILMNSPRLRGLFGGKKQPPYPTNDTNPTADYFAATATAIPSPPHTPPLPFDANHAPYSPPSLNEYEMQVNMPISTPPAIPLEQPRPKRLPQPLPPIPRKTTASPVRIQPSLTRLEIGAGSKHSGPSTASAPALHVLPKPPTVVVEEWSAKSAEAAAPRPLPSVPAPGPAQASTSSSATAGPSSAEASTSAVKLPPPPPPPQQQHVNAVAGPSKLTHQRTLSNKIIIPPPPPPPPRARSASRTRPQQQQQQQQHKTKPSLSVRYQSMTVDPDSSGSSSKHHHHHHHHHHLASAPVGHIRPLPSVPMSVVVKPAPIGSLLASSSGASGSGSGSGSAVASGSGSNTNGRYIPAPARSKRPKTSPSGGPVRSPFDSIPTSWASRPIDLNRAVPAQSASSSSTLASSSSSSSSGNVTSSQHQQQRQRPQPPRTRSHSRPRIARDHSVDSNSGYHSSSAYGGTPARVPAAHTGKAHPRGGLPSPGPSSKPPGFLTAGGSGGGGGRTMPGRSVTLDTLGGSANGRSPKLNIQTQNLRSKRLGSLSPPAGPMPGPPSARRFVPKVTYTYPLEEEEIQTVTATEMVTPLHSHPLGTGMMDTGSDDEHPTTKTTTTTSQKSSPVDLDVFIDDKDLSSPLSRSPSPMQYARPDSRSSFTDDDDEGRLERRSRSPRRRQRNTQLRSYRNSYRPPPESPPLPSRSPSPIHYARRPSIDPMEVDEFSPTTEPKRRTQPRSFQFDYRAGANNSSSGTNTRASSPERKSRDRRPVRLSMRTRHSLSASPKRKNRSTVSSSATAQNQGNVAGKTNSDTSLVLDISVPAAGGDGKGKFGTRSTPSSLKALKFKSFGGGGKSNKEKEIDRPETADTSWSGSGSSGSLGSVTGRGGSGSTASSSHNANLAMTPTATSKKDGGSGGGGGYSRLVSLPTPHRRAESSAAAVAVPPLPPFDPDTHSTSGGAPSRGSEYSNNTSQSSLASSSYNNYSGVPPRVRTYSAGSGSTRSTRSIKDSKARDRKREEDAAFDEFYSQKKKLELGQQGTLGRTLREQQDHGPGKRWFDIGGTPHGIEARASMVTTIRNGGKEV